MQTAKTLCKTIVSPITYLGVGIAWLFELDNEPLNSWKFEGIAKDALMDLKLLDKIGSSTMGIIFALPRKYASLRAAFRSSIKITILGKHHGKSKGGSEYILKDAQRLTFLMRLDYSKLVLDQERIYTHSKGNFIYSDVLEKIYAG